MRADGVFGICFLGGQYYRQQKSMIRRNALNAIVGHFSVVRGKIYFKVKSSFARGYTKPENGTGREVYRVAD